MNEKPKVEGRKLTPVFFRKEAVTEETKPNALYCRPMGIVAGEECCEIEYHQEKWIVRQSEALTVHQALQKQAEKYRAEIGQRNGESKLETAKRLGISTSTLSKRLKLIQNHCKA